MVEGSGVTIVDASAQATTPNAAGKPWLNRAVSVGKVLVAGGLLVWLFTSDRLDFSAFRNIRHWEYLGLAATSLLLNMTLLVWRWLWLLRIQQLQVGWLAALRMTWFGYFATVFLPGAAGGDLAKAYASCQHEPRAKTRAVSTVFMDRALGLHSFLFIGSAAGLYVLANGCTARQASVAWLSFLCLGIASAGLFLLLWHRSSNFAVRLLPRRFRTALTDSLGFYRQARTTFVAIWLYSVLCNLSVIAAYILVAMALEVGATLAQVLTVPLAIVAGSLPISPGGLGVGEAAGAQLFSEFGLRDGALVVLIIRLGVIVFSTPGATSFLVGTKRPRVPVHRKEPT